MDKFGRVYRLQVRLPDGRLITAALPFTIEFDIIRNTYSRANAAKIRLYNLSPDKRNLIRKPLTDKTSFLYVQLDAGYGDQLATIFSGNVSQAWSVREGVDYVTQMECFDGGYDFTNATTDQSYPKGSFITDLITGVMKDLRYTQKGAVGNFPGQLQRGMAISGSSADILRELTNGGFFIDNGKAYALNSNEYVNDGRAIVVNADTGLIGTPLLESTKATFEMIFEPALTLGRLARIESLTESNFNGDYIITAVKHRGVISAAVAGTAYTTGEFLFTKLISGVRP